VSKGLESALNIDRESFNNAHPHAVYITKWLHSALRQLATTQKKLASGVRQASRTENRDRTVKEIQSVENEVWSQEWGDDSSKPRRIEVTECGTKSSSESDVYVYTRSSVLTERRGRQSAERRREMILEEKIKAIAQVLASFGLLDSLSKRKQEKLLNAIYRI